MDCFSNLLSIVMVKKFRQRHSPDQPSGVDLHLLRFVRQNEMDHGWYVTTWLHCNCLARADCQGRRCPSLGAYMVGGNRTYWVHQPCIVAETKNLFSCVRDPEFVVGLDQCQAGEEQWTHAVVDDVGFEDGPALTEESGAQASAVCEVRLGQRLEWVGVPNGKEVCPTDLRHDRNVWAEVEVNRQLHKICIM